MGLKGSKLYSTGLNGSETHLTRLKGSEIHSAGGTKIFTGSLRSTKKSGLNLKLTPTGNPVLKKDQPLVCSEFSFNSAQ